MGGARRHCHCNLNNKRGENIITVDSALFKFTVAKISNSDFYSKWASLRHLWRRIVIMVCKLTADPRSPYSKLIGYLFLCICVKLSDIFFTRRQWEVTTPLIFSATTTQVNWNRHNTRNALPWSCSNRPRKSVLEMVEEYRLFQFISVPPQHRLGRSLKVWSRSKIKINILI